MTTRVCMYCFMCTASCVYCRDQYVYVGYDYNEEGNVTGLRTGVDGSQQGDKNDTGVYVIPNPTVSELPPFSEFEA